MSILYVISNNKQFYKRVLEDDEAKEYYFEASAGFPAGTPGRW